MLDTDIREHWCPRFRRYAEDVGVGPFEFDDPEMTAACEDCDGCDYWRAVRMQPDEEGIL